MRWLPLIATAVLLTAGYLVLDSRVSECEREVSEAEKKAAMVKGLGPKLDSIQTMLNGFLRDWKERLQRIEAWRDSVKK